MRGTQRVYPGGIQMVVESQMVLAVVEEDADIREATLG
jgi:hypothetical protein